MKQVKTRKSIKKDDYEDLIYYKLKNSKFKQQRLPAWRPVPTLCSIIVFYILFAIIFVGLGIVLLLFSNKIMYLEIPYNEKCKDQKICNITIDIKDDMNPPIMIYYKLYGFYQNHRRYIKSKSQNQLFGKNDEDDGDCGPVFTNEEMKLNQYISINGTPLEPKDVAVPCGLMAKTYFNDTFKNWTINGTPIIPDETNIAFPMDKKFFKNGNISKQWVDMEDEHFIVWMRPSAFPNFRKLWGRINDVELKKGQTISFIIENNYALTLDQGRKSVVLSTTTMFGGKNMFLGIGFIVVGVVSFLLGIAFPMLILQRNKNEKLKRNY